MGILATDRSVPATPRPIGCWRAWPLHSSFLELCTPFLQKVSRGTPLSIASPRIRMPVHWGDCHPAHPPKLRRSHALFERAVSYLVLLRCGTRRSDAEAGGETTVLKKHPAPIVECTHHGSTRALPARRLGSPDIHGLTALHLSTSHLEPKLTSL
jgi:hypothetical protein